jgi:hypothetical protein
MTDQCGEQGRIHVACMYGNDQDLRGTSRLDLHIYIYIYILYILFVLLIYVVTCTYIY